MIETYEYYLACLGCGTEKVLGKLLALDMWDAKNESFHREPMVSEEGLFVRKCQWGVPPGAEAPAGQASQEPHRCGKHL